MAPKSKKAGPAKVEGGKGGRGGEVKKIRSKSVKAGLQFPVTRIGRYLKKGMKLYFICYLCLTHYYHIYVVAHV